MKPAPVLRLGWRHSEARRLVYWNGWRYPLLTHVVTGGVWMGRGGAMIVGPFMLWWQWPERFVAINDG